MEEKRKISLRKIWLKGFKFLVFGNKPLTKLNLQKYLSNEVFVKLPEFVGFMIVGFKLLQTKTKGICKIRIIRRIKFKLRYHGQY